MVKKTAVLSLWLTADKASFLLHATSFHTTRQEKDHGSAVVVSAVQKTLHAAHSASSSAEV
jgi:hypothetical protein